MNELLDSIINCNDEEIYNLLNKNNETIKLNNYFYLFIESYIEYIRYENYNNLIQEELKDYNNKKIDISNNVRIDLSNNLKDVNEILYGNKRINNLHNFVKKRTNNNKILPIIREL